MGLHGGSPAHGTGTIVAKNRQAGKPPGAALFREVARRAGSRANTVLILAIVLVLAIGWLRSGERHLTPEEGIGYLLGIAGSAMMLLLLLYPMRKRIRALRSLGSVRFWFHFHMVLGLVGPTLIILHSNYALGSTNSTIAFLAMMTVMLSGLVGRFLYGRIHIGFSQQKAAARDLLADAAIVRRGFADLLSGAPEIEARLADIDDLIISMPHGLIGSLRHSARILRDANRAERAVTRRVEARLRDLGHRGAQRRRRMAALRRSISRYFAEIRRAATLASCERLFALWHVLHLPLFVMLVLCAIMHVIAVHLY